MTPSHPTADAEIDLALLRELRPAVAQLTLFTEPLPYNTRKYLAIDQMGRQVAFVLCSPPTAPDIVAVDVERRMMARRTLGSLSSVVLEPLKSGAVGELTYAMYPLCRRPALSRLGWSVERIWIRTAVMSWLRAATQLTVDRPADHEIDDLFRTPLAHLIADVRLPDELRGAASVALGRLESGSWRPRVCLMHGDLWPGNVLLAPGTRSRCRFVLIDWAGSMIRGHGVYDLTELAMSMGMRRRRVVCELRIHCQTLECNVIDSRSYLLSALGYFAMNMGVFPFERFMQMALHYFHYLSSLLPTGPV